MECKRAEEYTDAFARRVHVLVKQVAMQHVPIEDFCVATQSAPSSHVVASHAAPAVAIVARPIFSNTFCLGGAAVPPEGPARRRRPTPAPKSFRQPLERKRTRPLPFTSKSAMPAALSKGQARGLWQLMIEAGLDTPTGWGYDHIQEAIANPEAPWTTKHAAVCNIMKKLIGLAFDVLSNPHCEKRYRAGCDTKFENTPEGLTT